jgi:hypothetical protein
LIDFDLENLSTWSINPQLSNPSGTYCGTYRVLGGFNNMDTSHSVEKTFLGLEPHTSGRVKIKLLKIDSWDVNGGIKIYVDDALIKTVNLYSVNQADWSRNQCGNSVERDQEIILDQTFSHVSNSLTIKFQKVGSTQANYWGLSKLELKVYNCAPFCKECLNSNTCKSCGDKQYLTSFGCRCYEK